ncbi:hypothetical protein [Mesorhizobium sp. NFR06]|nr:hypothetical protein [Mesorhizobium sp. NFR06]
MERLKRRIFRRFGQMPGLDAGCVTWISGMRNPDPPNFENAFPQIVKK